MDSTQRIATQLDIVAYYDNDVPSVHFTPAYDSTGVHPNTIINISFSKPVHKLFAGEIQNSDIPFLVEFKETFIEGESVPFEGVISEDKTIITIIPDQSLKVNQQYFIKLNGNQLVDDDGNVIKLDEENYFTTGQMTGLETQVLDGLAIYPNPTKGYFTLSFPGEENKEIKIFTTAGVLVFDEHHKKSRLDIDLSGHPDGTYLLSISDEMGNTIHSAKIIKH
jgi:hypothetical protein